MHGGEYEFTAGPRVVESARQQPYREEQQFEEDGCVSTVAAAAAAAVRPPPSTARRAWWEGDSCATGSRCRRPFSRRRRALPLPSTLD